MNKATSFRLHIRPLFRDLDIEHMLPIGIDLGSYEQVRDRSARVFGALQGKTMPPANADGPWPDEWIALFSRWIDEGSAP